MDKPDNDNGRQFHITLNNYDRRALDFVRSSKGAISKSAALRVCIRAAALQLGFSGALDASQEIFEKK